MSWKLLSAVKDKECYEELLLGTVAHEMVHADNIVEYKERFGRIKFDAPGDHGEMFKKKAKEI